MAYSSFAVANEFLRLAKRDKRSLTNMQLQKLVYIANGYHLAIENGEPLYYHDTKAWRFGPVIVQLYKKLKKYGSDVVSDLVEADDKIDDNSEQSGLIEAVWENYGDKSGPHLSNITHKPGTPWDIVWNELGLEWKDIPPALIQKHYEGLISNNEPV